MSVLAKSELEELHHDNIQRYDIRINNENKFKYFPSENNLNRYNNYNNNNNNNQINKEIEIQIPNQKIYYDNIRDKAYPHSDFRYKLTPNDKYLNQINQGIININNIQNNDQQNPSIITQDTTIIKMNETIPHNSNINIENKCEINNEQKDKKDIKKEEKKEEKKCLCCKCNSTTKENIEKCCMTTFEIIVSIILYICYSICCSALRFRLWGS